MKMKIKGIYMGRTIKYKSDKGARRPKRRKG
jgi:hypothetical protein